MRWLLVIALLVAGCGGDELEPCRGNPDFQCEPICNARQTSISTRDCDAITDVDGSPHLCEDTIGRDGREGCCFADANGITRFAECAGAP